MSYLGEKVKEDRKAVDLNQKDLSDRMSALGIGVDQPWVSRVERGVVIPSPRELTALAEVLTCGNPTELDPALVQERLDLYKTLARQNFAEVAKDPQSAAALVGDVLSQVTTGSVLSIETPPMGPKSLQDPASLAAIHNIVFRHQARVDLYPTELPAGSGGQYRPAPKTQRLVWMLCVMETKMENEGIAAAEAAIWVVQNPDASVDISQQVLDTLNRNLTVWVAKTLLEQRKLTDHELLLAGQLASAVPFTIIHVSNPLASLLVFEGVVAKEVVSARRVQDFLRDRQADHLARIKTFKLDDIRPSTERAT